MTFFVYEDIMRAPGQGPAIHTSTCREEYLERNPNPVTSRWHGPFDYATAEEIALDIERQHPGSPARLNPSCCHPANAE